MPDVSELQVDSYPQPTAPLGVLPGIAAEKYGDTPFMSDTPWAAYDGPVRTFADFAAAIDDYADRLWAAGIGKGDRVAVVQRNHIEVEGVMCALGKIGALPALLSSAMEVGELLECIAKLGQPYVLVDSFGYSRLSDSRHALSVLAKRVLSLTDVACDWVAPARDRAAHVTDPATEDEWFVITHSSGTTGLPKLAAHSTKSLFDQVAPLIMIYRSQYSTADLNAKHLSFVHVRTCGGTLASLETGIPMLSIADPSLPNIKRLLLEHQPTSVETHPNIFIQWEPLADDLDRPLAGVERFISTFDAIHPRTVRTLLGGSDRPSAHYLQAYGQTESGPACLRIVTRGEAETYSPRNVGYSGGKIEVRVVDPAGTPLPAGQAGYVETRSPGRMRGYVGGPPMIAEDDWWPMGDIGRLLPDGSLELLDRIVDHVEGTASLLEKEDQILELLPELVELVLVRSDTDGGVFAVACARSGAACDVERFWKAAEQVGLGRIPIRFWEWEALPLTGSYKVRRGVLRQRLAARISADAGAQAG